ncbi:MAG: hypothetical protein GY724_16960 [Actinomycetia bacterium]|nr:hypothetical protein [Actinomycetes bacterium]MCP4224360.1 hypothetical protein [Actinomycetes bacterium]MCP5031596.1 hypothetical protein [Actinomycetes bacterium]
MTSNDESEAGAEAKEFADVVAESDFTHSAYSVEGELERLGAAALIARRGGRSPIVRAIAIGIVGATALSILIVIGIMVGAVIS